VYGGEPPLATIVQPA
jgi:hypothetical protein